MSSITLIRLGGLAAIIAGILRGVTSFLPSTLSVSSPSESALDSLPGTGIALLYLLVDIFLLFGTIGLYGFLYRKSGIWGFAGFMLAVIGLALIRTGEISGVLLYPVGASLFTLGISSFAIGAWIAGQLPRWISVCWVLSTIVGFLGYFVPALSLLFSISGALLGIGFASAGLKMWSLTNPLLAKPPLAKS